MSTTVEPQRTTSLFPEFRHQVRFPNNVTQTLRIGQLSTQFVTEIFEADGTLSARSVTEVMVAGRQVAQRLLEAKASERFTNEIAPRFTAKIGGGGSRFISLQVMGAKMSFTDHAADELVYWAGMTGEFLPDAD